MKAQKVLEHQYMGPEIIAVQPTPRQVAAQPQQQPVIQYIVAPQQPQQPTATGTIVSTNQVIWDFGHPM